MIDIYDRLRHLAYMPLREILDALKLLTNFFAPDSKRVNMTKDPHSTGSYLSRIDSYSTNRWLAGSLLVPSGKKCPC